MDDKIAAFIEARKLEVGLALAGLILIGVGGLWWKAGMSEPKVEVLRSAENQNYKQSVAVDLGGGVNRPGVYELKDGARVGEAVSAAGGLSSAADMEWVEKYLNQAEKVTDGQKIYIPIESSSDSGEKLNINKATQAELEALPGVGEVTAGKIIAGRPYSKVEDLEEKKIVGAKVFADIRDLVSVW